MFNIALSRHEYLFVVCTGGPVLNDYLAAVGLIADVVERERIATVLVDLSAIPYGMSDEERLELARFAIRRLPEVRIAILAYAPERLQHAEHMAQRAGMAVKVFEDIKLARDWLASAPPPGKGARPSAVKRGRPGKPG